MKYWCHVQPIPSTEKDQNAIEDGGHDSTDSVQGPTVLTKLGLVPSTSSAMITAQNSNTIEEKLDNQDETKKPEEEKNLNEVSLLPKDIPVQKNKKKCWSCKSKLELAQRELGLCKCGEYDVMGHVRKH